MTFLVSILGEIAHRPPPLEGTWTLGDTAAVQGLVTSDLLSGLRWPRTAALLVFGVSACGGAGPSPSGDSAAKGAEEPKIGAQGDAAAAGKAAEAKGSKAVQEPAAPKLSAKERAAQSFKPDEAKAHENAFRESLSQGRKEVKAKRYAEGIKAFEAALKIDPNHPSALAELGWAAFLSGDLAVAERYTRRAIDSTGASDRTRGAALYNLGRIHEEQGDRVAAVTAYTRSLRLRDNTVVAKRLAALEGEGAQVEENECELTKIDGRPPFDLCAAFMDGKLGTTEDFESSACDERDTYTTEVAEDASGIRVGGETATRIALDLGDGIEIATFGVTHNMIEGGEMGTTYVAILYPDRWYVGMLGGEYNPGVGYIGESFEVKSVVSDELVPGGRPEVIVTALWQYHDGDYGENTMEFGDDTIVVHLSVDGDSPRWLGAVKTSVVTGIGPMIEGEPADVEESSSEKRVELSYHRSSGEYELKAVSGQEPPSKPGRHKFGEGPALCPAVLSYVSPG